MLTAAGLAVSTAWCKPPDLPVNFKDVCVPQCPCTSCQENNTIFSGNFAAGPQTQPEAENRQVRMGRRALREAAAEQLEARLKEFLAGKTTADFVATALQQWVAAVGIEKEASANFNYNEYSAGRFYEIAKECEARGDLAMARNCYEEATRMCPESAAAKLASADCLPSWSPRPPMSQREAASKPRKSRPRSSKRSSAKSIWSRAVSFSRTRC